MASHCIWNKAKFIAYTEQSTYLSDFLCIHPVIQVVLVFLHSSFNSSDSPSAGPLCLSFAQFLDPTLLVPGSFSSFRLGPRYFLLGVAFSANSVQSWTPALFCTFLLQNLVNFLRNCFITWFVHVFMDYSPTGIQTPSGRSDYMCSFQAAAPGPRTVPGTVT